MRRLVVGAATVLLLMAALSGCGGGGSGSSATIGTLRGVYTLNGGGGMNVDGTVSFINTAQNNAVTLRAFDAGKVPNYMA
ncbi:MAG: hypothetical protein QHJ73_08300, partial [Armatimonadota bacterium]|nr:hypothetical protein [Armatimonadota bacterium]